MGAESRDAIGRPESRHSPQSARPVCLVRLARASGQARMTVSQVVGEALYGKRPSEGHCSKTLETGGELYTKLLRYLHTYAYVGVCASAHPPTNQLRDYMALREGTESACRPVLVFKVRGGLNNQK